jgi:hypothetical protein
MIKRWTPPPGMHIHEQSHISARGAAVRLCELSQLRTVLCQNGKTDTPTMQPITASDKSPGSWYDHTIARVHAIAQFMQPGKQG